LTKIPDFERFNRADKSWSNDCTVSSVCANYTIIERTTKQKSCYEQIIQQIYNKNKNLTNISQ